MSISQSQSKSGPAATSVKGLAMINTRTLVGIDALPVVVEVHLANGLPAFATVGLPETAVRESKDRVRGAILNSGFEFPARRITVNLAPADLPKTGGRFDLPIALGILIASGQLSVPNINRFELVGELALDGRLRNVAGVLPTALACCKSGRTLIVPDDNAGEAALAKHADCLRAGHLLEVCYHLAGETEIPRCHVSEQEDEDTGCLELADVRGQPHAKRALEIAASGNHSLLFVGPPGTGKSMLASRLPGILPRLSSEEALQTAAIHSIASGQFNSSEWRRRPFRNPHHSASSVALVGGGSYPKPGEISLAHCGVLFLDELTEFSRATLEHLREPLETGMINIARASQSVKYPAKFLLVAACNPCPCGYAGDGTDRCRCSAARIENYRNKLSGPLLDRFDMHVHLPRLDTRTLHARPQNEEQSSLVRQRVEAVRGSQLLRQGRLNSELQGQDINRYCRLDEDTYDFLDATCERLRLSARAYHRILRLARTIADLQPAKNIARNHVAEAINYRKLDRPV